MLIGYFLWACFLPSFLWFHIYALGVYICFYKIIINYWSNFWYTFILMSSSFVLTFSKEVQFWRANTISRSKSFLYPVVVKIKRFMAYPFLSLPDPFQVCGFSLLSEYKCLRFVIIFFWGGGAEGCQFEMLIMSGPQTI